MGTWPQGQLLQIQHANRHRYGYNYNNNSTWYTWGRWVLFGALVAAGVLLFLIISCISARRRRKRGAQPFYGTGWMATHGQPQYYGNNAQGQGQSYPQQEYNSYSQQYNQQGGQGGYGQQNAAPPYSPPSNQGYYGQGQSQGIELQQPQSVYQARDTTYAPPSMPPPGKA